MMPTRKVGAATLGGAISIIAVTVLEAASVDVAPELASAISTVCAFALGYLVPEAG